MAKGVTGTVVLGLVLILGGGVLWGGNTAYWEVNDKTTLRQGEMENLILTTDGSLQLTKTITKIEPEKEEPSFWTSAVNPKGETYFGSGSGKVFKLENNKLREVYDTKEILVTSLLISKQGEIFIGTIPNGKIFKMEGSGKFSEFAKLSSGYVWSLVFGPKEETIFAATGPDGKVYKIDRDGKSEVFYDTKKQVHILCLLFDNKDSLYFGTSNPGVLYRMATTGRPVNIVGDFGENEIKSLAYQEGTLFVAVNSGIKMPPQEFLSAVRQRKRRLRPHPSHLNRRNLKEKR